MRPLPTTEIAHDSANAFRFNTSKSSELVACEERCGLEAKGYSSLLASLIARVDELCEDT